MAFIRFNQELPSGKKSNVYAYETYCNGDYKGKEFHEPCDCPDDKRMVQLDFIMDGKSQAVWCTLEELKQLMVGLNNSQ